MSALTLVWKLLALAAALWTAAAALAHRAESRREKSRAAEGGCTCRWDWLGPRIEGPCPYPPHAELYRAYSRMSGALRLGDSCLLPGLEGPAKLEAILKGGWLEGDSGVFVHCPPPPGVAPNCTRSAHLATWVGAERAARYAELDEGPGGALATTVPLRDAEPFRLRKRGRGKRGRA